MTTCIMRDAIRASSIPVHGTDIAVGYINGSVIRPTWNDVLARFQSIPKVAVDVNGSAPGAQVRDWETGDKGGSLEDWVQRHNQLSGARDAVVYCNRATIAEVRQLTGSQVLGQDYYLWVATLDGTVFGPSQLAGVIACQNKGSDLTGGDYDESIVWADPDVWWSDGIINSPAPPPPVTGPLPDSWAYGPVDPTGPELVSNYGPHSFAVSFSAPSSTAGFPAGVTKPGITNYQVSVCRGSAPGAVIDGYPRYIAKGANPQTAQFGGLDPAAKYWIGSRAMYQGGNSGPWVSSVITTPAS